MTKSEEERTARELWEEAKNIHAIHSGKMEELGRGVDKILKILDSKKTSPESPKHIYKCKGENCNFSTDDIDTYIQHVAGSFTANMKKELEEKIKEQMPKAKDIIASCEGELCKFIEERYNVQKKDDRGEKSWLWR